MPTRRELLRKIGVGAASTAAFGPGSALAVSQKATLEAFAIPSKEAPWWLLNPLQTGDQLGLGWTLQTLEAVKRGAAILELSHSSGEMARIHICAYESDPKGLAHTALFDLILMDGGHGDKPTEESIGRVLMTLAEKMRQNELEDHADLAKVRRMLTHGERVDLYGPESLT